MPITQNADIINTFELDMIPDSAPVLVYCDQYDHGEGRLIIHLINDGVPYEPLPGSLAIIQGTKPDGHGFIYSGTIDGSTVIADLTEQMTACYGRTRVQVVVTEGNDRTGTYVFYLQVQKSALQEDTDLSRSDYALVEQMIEEAEAISVNVPYIGANGNWWIYSVSAGGYIDSGVDASITVDIADTTMLAPDAQPYVTNTGTNTDPIFHLFIPRGQTGATGADGVSPTVTITAITGGHRVTITDADHPTGQSFDVMDGEMLSSVYDPDGSVANAGGIPAYTGEIGEEIVKDTVGWVGKNLLPNMAVTRTLNGVTFTVNADGSVKVNGTATADAIITLETLSEISGEVKLSGCPSGGSLSTYFIMVQDRDPNTFTGKDTGNSYSFTAISGTKYRFSIGILSGTTVSNLYFYPMLRRADIAESTYEPYHETVDECKFDRSEQRVLGAKNLFNAYDPSTAANVTVTDNGRSINMLWATPTAWLNRQWDVYLPKNTDFILYTRAEKTVGKSGVTVRAQDRSTQIYNAGTSDDAVKIYKFTFNTGNNDFVNIVLNASTSTAEAGDVTYKDFMIRLASDPDDTYAPYAMTNRELTETHDEWTAEETVSSDLRVTFAGLNDAYGYSTPCVQDKLVSVTSMIKAGRDTNVALTFTLSGATAGDKAKLRIFK
jgi:hypothetical protein